MSDINSMLVTLGQSIPALNSMTIGFAYMMGIGFCVRSLMYLHSLSNKKASSSIRGGWLSPVAYLVMGSALLWLPTSFGVVQKTLFGVDSPLAYAPTTSQALQQLYASPTYVVGKMLQLSGVVWFVRGCILVAHSSDPGVQHGERGFYFIVGGALASNYTGTISLIKSTVNLFVTSVHNLYPIQQTISSYFSG